MPLLLDRIFLIAVVLELTIYTAKVIFCCISAVCSCSCGYLWNLLH